MPKVALVYHDDGDGNVELSAQLAAEAVRQAGGRAVILTGTTPGSRRRSSGLKRIDGLSLTTGGKTNLRELLGELKSVARRHLGGAPELWHFFNHSLGESHPLAATAAALAESGAPLLLELRGFAENFRPENYAGLLRRLGRGETARLKRRLYPQTPSAHYAALSCRDRDFLTAAGLPPARLHLLPLPAAPAPQTVPENPGGRTFLNRLRDWRRGNPGELLLWAALAEPGDRFLSLCQKSDNNPEARAWREFARRENLPVDFAAAPPNRWEDSPAPEAVLLTAVAADSPLPLLEPWLSGVPATGRKQPELAEEPEQNGLELSGLYSRLDVPLEWAGGASALRKKLIASLRRVYAAYGRELTTAHLEQAYAAAVWDGTVDFGRLDAETQRQVVRGVARLARREKSPLRLPWDSGPKNLLAANRAAAAKYAPAAYATELLQVYAKVLSGNDADAGGFDCERLLDRFLDPQRFCLLYA